MLTAHSHNELLMSLNQWRAGGECYMQCSLILLSSIPRCLNENARGRNAIDFSDFSPLWEKKQQKMQARVTKTEQKFSFALQVIWPNSWGKCDFVTIRVKTSAILLLLPLQVTLKTPLCMYVSLFLQPVGLNGDSMNLALGKLWLEIHFVYRLSLC